MGVDHDLGENDVEAFDDQRTWCGSLDPLAQRVGRPDEQARAAGREVQRVAGVQQDLAAEVLRSGEPDDLLRGFAQHRQHNHLAEPCRLGQGPEADVGSRVAHPALKSLGRREPIITGWP
jgi:hypothetical protein